MPKIKCPWTTCKYNSSKSITTEDYGYCNNEDEITLESVDECDECNAIISSLSCSNYWHKNII